MPDTFAAKLKSLGFEFLEGHTPPSEKLVAQFERRFKVKLPPDYRDFLVRFGGVQGSAVCHFQESTPCGPSTIIDGFYGFEDDEIGEMTETIDGAPAVVAIGDNQMGAMFWLICQGPEAGSVYMHDHQGRSAWSDQQFKKWFPNLAPEIKNYLDLRRQGKLPKKAKGYEHVYLLARSFSEFIDSLEPDKSDDE